MRKHLIIAAILMVVGVGLVVIGLLTNEPPIYKHKNKSDEKTKIQVRMDDPLDSLLVIEVF